VHAKPPWKICARSASICNPFFYATGGSIPGSDPGLWCTPVGYDDLVDHCCEAWNKLVDQPWRIMSIGLRQWAHEF
jgi:hypothetical protein